MHDWSHAHSGVAAEAGPSWYLTQCPVNHHVFPSGLRKQASAQAWVASEHRHLCPLVAILSLTSGSFLTCVLVDTQLNMWRAPSADLWNPPAVSLSSLWYSILRITANLGFPKHSILVLEHCWVLRTVLVNYNSDWKRSRQQAHLHPLSWDIVFHCVMFSVSKTAVSRIVHTIWLFRMVDFRVGFEAAYLCNIW